MWTTLGETMIALIDGDLLTYPVSASCEDCDENIVIARFDKAAQDILDTLGAESYRMFLTGSNNFRKEINPEYKANRKDKPLPKFLNLLREYAVSNWKAEVTDGYEADDALGMNQTEETILCSYDKDLDMIPGEHYNWNKGITYKVTEIDALRSFYRSLLVGDRADNIVGVANIGKVKAAKIIDHLNDEQEMLEAVKSLYDSEERLDMNGACLWIWRKENDIWHLT